VVIAAGPGSKFDPESSGPTVLAAYALFPPGQSSAAQAKLEAQLRTTPTGSAIEPPELKSPPLAPNQPIPFSHRATRWLEWTAIIVINCQPMANRCNFQCNELHGLSSVSDEGERSSAGNGSTGQGTPTDHMESSVPTAKFRFLQPSKTY